MEPMRRAFRYAFAVIGSATIAMAGTASVSAAAVTMPNRVVSIEPATGQVVGVAAPVVVAFSAPVTDRIAAQRLISITSPDTPTGEFTWLSNDVVQWKPERFWPSHSKMSVTAGGASTSFETGAAVVGVADISAHTFTVSIDDQVVREMPASMGKPK